MFFDPDENWLLYPYSEEGSDKFQRKTNQFKALNISFHSGDLSLKLAAIHEVSRCNSLTFQLQALTLIQYIGLKFMCRSDMRSDWSIQMTATHLCIRMFMWIQF